MNLRLMFKNLENDIFAAIALVRINDTNECDAPAKILSTGKSKRFDLLAVEPSVDLDVDIQRPNGPEELTVTVLVEGTTSRNESVRFIDTQLTPLPENDANTVSIALEKI